MSTDLARKPILLSFFFLLFLSLVSPENTQDLASDILLFRGVVPLGLATPEFPNLSASNIESTLGNCKGWIVPYPVPEAVVSRWFRPGRSGVWTIQKVEDLWDIPVSHIRGLAMRNRRTFPRRPASLSRSSLASASIRANSTSSCFFLASP